MTHGSLFSGIGGFDLSAQWMGWENVFHCEINPFGQKILKHYWPNATSYSDIKTTDFTIHRGEIDILTGGFPCQPYSTAGKRLGKEDERHLWPEMLRAIREIQPRFVVGENVRGLTNWNGGLVFDQVQTDLEAEGYEVLPFLLPAAGVNAPHRRDRIWFIAHSHGLSFQDGTRNEKQGAQKISEKRFNESFAASYTNKQGLEKQQCISGNDGAELSALERDINGWENWPSQSPVRLRNDGISRDLERYINNSVIYEISKTSEENRIKDLPGLWDIIQQEEIWQKIRRFYALESKEVLFKTMQLYSTGWSKPGKLSSFSEVVSGPILQHLRKYKEFRCSPQGSKLQKQRAIEFGDTLPYLPHEVALAAKRFESQLEKFEMWHRQESIKAGGNAIVPQVVYQIFKAIEQYDNSLCMGRQSSN